MLTFSRNVHYVLPLLMVWFHFSWFDGVAQKILNYELMNLPPVCFKCLFGASKITTFAFFFFSSSEQCFTKLVVYNYGKKKICRW